MALPRSDTSLLRALPSEHSLTPFARAAHLVVIGICSPATAAQVSGHSRDAVRRAALKMVSDKDKIGKPGRPTSLGPRNEAKIKVWLNSEIAANRDPDVTVALKKATLLRAEVTGEDLDVHPVQQT